MAQERTINDLIVLALYQTNVVAVGENIDNFMQQTALEIVNLLLDSFSEAQIYIPFPTSIDFTMEVGKDVYTVSEFMPADIIAKNISEITFASFRMGDNNELVRPIRVIDDASYFNNLRINTLQAQPSWIFFENQPYVTTITFYPKPALAYPIHLETKSFLSHVELFTQISGLPRAFHEFLRLHIARQMSDFYPSAEWTDKMEKDYRKLEERVSAQQLNLTLEPSAILNRNIPWIYPTILSMP